MSASRSDTATRDRLRLAGHIGLWSSLAGALSGIVLLVADPSVTDDRFSYPFDASGFTIAQIFFFVQHLGLAVVLLAFARSEAGSSKIARIGFYGATVSMLGLAAMEILAISARNSAYPTPKTDTLESGYGVASTLIGVFLLVAGIAVLRSESLDGWVRWIPLALGIYVFVPLTPAIFGSFVVGRLGIIGWMLLFAVFSWILLRNPRSYP